MLQNPGLKNGHFHITRRVSKSSTTLEATADDVGCFLRPGGRALRYSIPDERGFVLTVAVLLETLKLQNIFVDFR